MSSFDIFTIRPGVNFAPNSELEEILQNCRTIISTRKGTVPNDRNFGISWSMIDRPINQARAAFSAEVVQQLRQYEPRANIVSIDLVESETGILAGKLQPRIMIEVNE